MKEKVGEVFSIAKDNPPVPGCTISKEISGVAPGTPFEALPDDWCCPVCGVSKDMFEKIGYSIE